MDLQEDWEPYLLPRYELELKAFTRSDKRSGEAPIYLVHPGAVGAINISHSHPTPTHPPPHPPGGGGGQPQCGGGGDITNAVVYYPSYNGTRCRALNYKAGPMMDVLKRASGIWETLPPPRHDASKDSYPSYHIKGLCNSRCGRAREHVPYPPETNRSYHGP